jgi:hypothetical protein
MIGAQEGTNNSILTGLTGLPDRTRCHIEWPIGRRVANPSKEHRVT